MLAAEDLQEGNGAGQGQGNSCFGGEQKRGKAEIKRKRLDDFLHTNTET